MEVKGSVDLCATDVITMLVQLLGLCPGRPQSFSQALETSGSLFSSSPIFSPLSLTVPLLTMLTSKEISSKGKKTEEKGQGATKKHPRKEPSL